MRPVYAPLCSPASRKLCDLALFELFWSFLAKTSSCCDDTNYSEPKQGVKRHWNATLITTLKTHVSDLRLFFPQMPSIESTSWRTTASCRAWWSWPITVTVLPARGWWSAAGRSESLTCKHSPPHSGSNTHGVALRRAQETWWKTVNVHYGNVLIKNKVRMTAVGVM